ncbi:hypothetical protein ACQKP0_23780 [Heyndrickxia sp. NPDC080065]|uniref:hypothetical protein n=1 Tax=Heyndrickxia sp. NPDC080065 TaxID=3390568 RepID=UPI003CFF5AE6
MKQQRKKLQKGIIMSSVIACGLVFGSMGIGVDAKAATNKTLQTSKSVKATQASATVSKKGVLTFPKKFSMKKVTNELKPEAAKLVKIYGDSLNTGATKSFNSYVNKHVAEHTNTNYLLGRKYVRDNYSKKVKGMRKVNSKKTLSAYSKELKKAKTSKIKVDNTYKGTGFATFTYQFRPDNFDAFGTVTVQFKFDQLKNGKYVLEDLYFIY